MQPVIDIQVEWAVKVLVNLAQRSSQVASESGRCQALSQETKSMGRIGLGELLALHNLDHVTKTEVKAMMRSREG